MGLFTAFRLAKPRSPWARAFYRDRKLERAGERFDADRRLQSLGRRLRDAIGGAPDVRDR